MKRSRTESPQTTLGITDQAACCLTMPGSPRETPIRYHSGVQSGDLELWADVAGVTVSQLMQATETTVRNCHQAAVRATKGDACHPDVYELGLGQLKVGYTVETNVIIIRGYTPNIPNWQVTEEEAGRYFSGPY